MKRMRSGELAVRALVAFGLAIALAMPVIAASAEGTTQTTAERGGTARYIVALKDGVSADDVTTAFVTGRGGVVTQRYQSALNGFAAVLSDDEVSALRSDPRVTGVMLDPVIHATDQTIPTGVNRIFAPGSTIANIDGVDERVDVDVAVLDTGSGPHPDLNIAGGVDCTGGSSYSDGNGHGTHVAGTIGALDNGAGVVGVAPGARIWAVKVLGSDGSGYGSWLICGIDWVTARASTIEVANMSLGGPGYADDNNCGYTNGDTIHQAICDSVAAGVTWAVAAGNDGKDAKDYFPAQYNEVITVSALNDSDGAVGNDTLASFSNYGADVDVIAPGVNILSSVPGGGYQSWSGTSMATPHATGAAALYKVMNPSATPAQVAAALRAAGSTSSWSGDKDSYKEPLLDVSTFDASGGGGGGGTTVDAQVVSVAAPSSVTQGQTASVSSQIKNNGSASASVSVGFQESPGGATQTKSVTVAAGATSTVSFSWATSSSTATGTHTFNVTATLAGDSNSGNNSGSASSNVVAGSTSTTDAQVVSVSAPASVTRGQTATISSQVKNNSSASKSISVKFQEAPGGATQTKSVTISAGATATVSFSWATSSSTATGTHTFTITTTLSGDSNSGNNSGTATTNVVTGSTSTTDAQVVSVTAPSSVTRGQTATVSSKIKNNSSASKSISVKFQEAPGGATQTKSVTISAGATATVSFSWATSSSTATGTHTFTITTTLSGDSNSGNNSGTATTNVTSGSSGTGSISVSAMTLSSSKISGGYRLTGRVTVKVNGAAVSSAKVTVQLLYPNGSKVTLSGTTSSTGIATFTRSVSAKGKYTLTVTSVSKSGMTYNAAGNVVSSVAVTIT